MNVEIVLENLGFSPNEIKVYLTLNDHGSTKAGKIARLAKIDRSSCYNALKTLTEKGLVSYVVIGQIKWFQAAGPKRLLDYLKEQEEDIKSVLPELHKRHKAAKIEGQVRLFKGIKGVKSIFTDIARTGKDNFVFGSEGQFSERMPEFALQFDRLKKENNVRTKLIIRRGRTELDGQTTEYRHLEGVTESPAVTNIYGNKIGIVIWTDEPEGIIIENAAAAKAYKSYFDVLWKHAKKESPHKA
ncbi:MAG: helix-turn-helix domain-containing protein [Candidatus Woesearchaeota archaeon]|jgi:sugar-specific transcriptional regulator TrmB|nr:helix-turn-helix domain-containing protein [Candidatus Woesearchaeota archaeon]MDP7182153.1 helix-turn-helix domain-containing protein [Candidatus Woesearchaeota archaeon]MDP7199067.1 helix-turn-helix domain-containing protein [Candidatus Woesearchaeota archaeon]MDP7467777.1 helix-turn-helix domain-containing protein [Candidatus Woesearchaeota archaeon]MDP7646480.1 helix-turn-helix domain-containing protein [Candidatus Woesearchaeota archaeon]